MGHIGFTMSNLVRTSGLRLLALALLACHTKTKRQSFTVLRLALVHHLHLCQTLAWRYLVVLLNVKNVFQPV